MSKLSFRARALDASKPMPIYKKDEISNKQDYTGHNRAVPQMPTGMEKEEETEHHLQRAISAQQVYGDRHEMVIPVPEAEISSEAYNSYYKKTFRMPKTYITNQAQALHLLEQDNPSYDMDTDDEEWVNKFNSNQSPTITCTQFESVIEQLEKSCGTQIISLHEAKILFKEDSLLMEKIFVYWHNKRHKEKNPLMFQIRQERRDGSSNNDSYVAFRRRTEKMQTRKNRKNDETSYGKMVKLRRDFCQVVTLFDMLRKRENVKSEIVDVMMEEFNKRLEVKDWDGKISRQAQKDVSQKERIKSHLRVSGVSYRKKRLAAPGEKISKASNVTAASISRGQIESRDYPPSKKKKVRTSTAASLSSNQLLAAVRNDNKRRNDHLHSAANAITSQPGSKQLNVQSSIETGKPSSGGLPCFYHRDLGWQLKNTDTDREALEYSDSRVTDENPFMMEDSAVDGDSHDSFTFRRSNPCDSYHKHIDNSEDSIMPWMKHPKYRYTLTSLRVPDKNIGFVRRRIGRGGRVLLDRAYHKLSRKITRLDLCPEHKHLPATDDLNQLLDEIRKDKWPHYVASRSPRKVSESEEKEEEKQLVEEATKRGDAVDNTTTCNRLLQINLAQLQTSNSTKRNWQRPVVLTSSTQQFNKSKCSQHLSTDHQLLLNAARHQVFENRKESVIVPSTPDNCKHGDCSDANNIYRNNNLDSHRISNGLDNSTSKCVTCGCHVSSTTSTTQITAREYSLKFPGINPSIPISVNTAVTNIQSSNHLTARHRPAVVPLAIASSRNAHKTTNVLRINPNSITSNINLHQQHHQDSNRRTFVSSTTSINQTPQQLITHYSNAPVSIKVNLPSSQKPYRSDDSAPPSPHDHTTNSTHSSQKLTQRSPFAKPLGYLSNPNNNQPASSLLKARKMFNLGSGSQFFSVSIPPTIPATSSTTKTNSNVVTLESIRGDAALVNRTSNSLLANHLTGGRQHLASSRLDRLLTSNSVQSTTTSSSIHHPVNTTDSTSLNDSVVVSHKNSDSTSTNKQAMKNSKPSRPMEVT